MSDFDWRRYWSDRTDGGHRFQDESYLRKEAAEKLFHLGTGDALLDFGCGSADLLVYYAAQYARVVGVDFSARMIEKAKERVKSVSSSCSVVLLEADDRSVWDVADGTFDRITAGQVIQYLTDERIDAFLAKAVERLAPAGKIVLFDIIEPRLFFLFELGLFGEKEIGRFELARRAVLLSMGNWRRRQKGLPLSELGYAHHPRTIARLAERHGLKAEIVRSMYYEYRYHAILGRSETASAGGRCSSR